MAMEAQDHQDFTDQTQIMIEGKRTKRQRPMSPLTLAMVSSSSSTGGGEYNIPGGEGGRISDHDHPATALTDRTENEEEEDMANCLILLAQGNLNQARKSSQETGTCTNYKAPSSAAAAARGLYVYQCKTCNRCFSSFQALGGHRASHKKPKANTNLHKEKKTSCLMLEEEDQKEKTHDRLLFNNMSTALSLRISNKIINKSKVHECSICGAEFSSGQALGGHMRRHRMFTKTSSTTTTTNRTTTTLSIGTSTSTSTPELSQESKKPRNNILQLDLNLPAPEDDHRESKFSFGSKEHVLVFSASSLVDCHY